MKLLCFLLLYKMSKNKTKKKQKQKKKHSCKLIC